MLSNKKLCSNIYSNSFTENNKLKRANSLETYVDPMYYRFDANKKLVRNNKDLSY
jgi:hypothetical protein